MRYQALFFSLSLSLICAGRVTAQQVPYFSQWYYNKVYYNVAFAPLEGRSEILATYRNMWSNIDGAPQTAAIIARMPLFSSRGAGATTLIYDRIGNFSYLDINIGYAYSLQLGKTYLSAGIKAGISRIGVDNVWISSSPDDPYRPIDDTSSILPVVGAGIALWSNRYYIGLSSINCIEFSHPITDALSLKEKNHIFLMGGYSWEIGRDVRLCPSGLVGSDMSSFSYTVNLSTVIKEHLIAGLSYGNEHSFGVNMGYIWKDLQVNYCYQSGLSGIASPTGGSHEILLIYRPSPKKRKSDTPATPHIVRNIRFL